MWKINKTEESERWMKREEEQKAREGKRREKDDKMKTKE